MQRVQLHLNRFLLGYAVAAMAVGLALGAPLADWTKAHASVLADLTTAGVFLIIFPMMVNVRFGALLKAGRNVRGLRAYRFHAQPREVRARRRST